MHTLTSDMCVCVWGGGDLTCPMTGWLHAPHTPLVLVVTPWLFMSSCKFPSMDSSSSLWGAAAGVEGALPCEGVLFWGLA